MTVIEVKFCDPLHKGRVGELIHEPRKLRIDDYMRMSAGKHWLFGHATVAPDKLAETAKYIYQTRPHGRQFTRQTISDDIDYYIPLINQAFLQEKWEKTVIMSLEIEYAVYRLYGYTTIFAGGAPGVMFGHHDK